MEKNLSLIYRAVFVGKEKHNPICVVDDGKLELVNINFGQTADIRLCNPKCHYSVEVCLDGQTKWVKHAGLWWWISELETENEHNEKYPNLFL